MTELGWTDYTLPSRGVLYKHPETGAPLLPGGVVQIRKQTAREANLLLQQGGTTASKVDAITSACLQVPKQFGDSKQLLLTDRFAVMLALRTKTFGPHYTYGYRCGGCGDQQRADVNIVEDFEEVVPDDDLVEPIEIKLPDLDKLVSLRFLRGTDEDQIVRNAKRLKMQSNDAQDPTYLLRLAMQVVAVEGTEDAVLKPLPFRQRFVEGLSASDVIYLEDALNEIEPGINTRVYPECRACGYSDDMPMPFDAEFFRPRRRRARSADA